MRIAIVRYVQSKRIPDVSDAVDKVGETMQMWLPPEALQNSNHFRARCCYNMQVADVLEGLESHLMLLLSQT